MSQLSKRARRRMRGLAKQRPVQTSVPTSGYYVIRRGPSFIATSWQFFTNPDFTMKGYAYDRDAAIAVYRKAIYKRGHLRPDASEFVDYRDSSNERS